MPQAMPTTAEIEQHRSVSQSLAFNSHGIAIGLLLLTLLVPCNPPMQLTINIPINSALLKPSHGTGVVNVHNEMAMC
jgi:hypothetical protein